VPSDERLRDASYRTTDFDPGAAADPPARARAVVVGGGIIGSSVALHLARLGWSDTVVLERGRVAGGTTWHAAGLMTRTRGTHMQTELASYSRDFYRDLAGLSGVDVGYYPNGSLSVARTPERLTELRYALTLAHHHGLPARELSREEIAEVSPLLAVGDLAGGVLFEDDATVNPGWAAFATAKAAHDLGVRFAEGARVTGFLLDHAASASARVTGVRTDRGDVECDVVVLAAGLWTHDLALLAGARVPLHPAEHYWAQTEPVDGATRDLPIVRDLDGSIYVRHYRGGLVVGAFEPDGRPRTASSIPGDFSFGEFPPDLEHFGRPLARARERVPALERARFAHYLCAPESFTPDGNFVLGESAEVAGLFVAAGMNSQGIILGPGVGRALAEWIDEGAPTVDAADVDVRRFSPAQNGAGYLFERTRESLGRLYAMHWPFLQPGTARGLRRVPLYGRLAAAGAVFGEAAGWERADWYAPPGVLPEYEYSFGRQNWFDAVAEEHRAAREGVALFDLSSFAKLRVEGPDALATVQRVFTADLDRPPGSVVYTSMLNSRGGLELDGTMTRLDEQAFQLVTSATAQTRALHWLRRHASPGAVVSDVTSGFGVLLMTGPRSRELLAGLTEADLSDQAFPFARAREIDAGWGPVLAVRVSFTGELGWELYAPVESLPALYERLVEVGEPLGLRHAGYRALDGLRAEKGYVHWGHDAGPADTPYEAGLAMTVAMDKPGGFVGREALAAAGPPRRRLVPILLSDPGPQLYHAESVVRDGRVIGRVMSGAYGHTLGAAVGLAALEGEPAEIDEVLAHGVVEVEIAAQRRPARVAARPFYDPDGRRLRGG
jgi:glycine cleavage system aminomethyltransferase T/glycine/D-amino acid oxidase-like deaminating enzyme